MRTVLLAILMTITTAVSAQNILDSIQLYDYPVKEGVIYKYENKGICTQNYATTLSIVSVITASDSVFHFEEGTVAGTFSLDDFHGITIRNLRNEFVTYSNLQSVSLKKGEQVNKGMCIGTTAASDDQQGINQVDILVLQKSKRLSYRKAIEYIRSKSNTAPKKAYYSTL